MSAKKLALSALFIALAAGLSALETLLPPVVPIAGVRVGLGNVITLLILYIGGKWKYTDALIIAVLRCFVAALITGSLLSAVYGIVGGILAWAAMLLARRLFGIEKQQKGGAAPYFRYPIKYLPFVGVFGAVAHIAGQLCTAAVFYGGVSVFAYTPVLMLSAVLGGIFTGLCAMFMLRKLSRKLVDDIRNV